MNSGLSQLLADQVHREALNVTDDLKHVLREFVASERFKGDLSRRGNKGIGRILTYFGVLLILVVFEPSTALSDSCRNGNCRFSSYVIGQRSSE